MSRLRSALPLLLLALAACDDGIGRPNWTWSRYEAANIVGHGLDAWSREHSFEVFNCDGAWRMHQEENVVTGTYTTRGDTICTTPDGGEQTCRRFRLRDDASVLQSRAQGDTPQRMYALQPLANVGACSPVRVDPQEVAPLMRGSEFSLPPGTIHDAPDTWSLRCDNTYVAYGGYEERPPREYSINEAGDVCMRRETERCFGLYRSTDGAYFMGPQSDAPEAPVTTLQPILIERQTTCAPN